MSANTFPAHVSTTRRLTADGQWNRGASPTTGAHHVDAQVQVDNSAFVESTFVLYAYNQCPPPPGPQVTRARVADEGERPTLEEFAADWDRASHSAAGKHAKASGELQVTARKTRSAPPKQRKTVPSGHSSLFEVSLQDVVALSDGDLRELVARLCSAELAEVDLPPTLVTWGGDQRAPDGGIDVRVQFPAIIERSPRILRAATGFQVKATRMGVGEIQREMCPNGLLRPSIRDLIREKGSYIIATSDSAADGEYRKRVRAMRNAVALEPGHELAEVDYYDARRLADWTNQKPGVVVWVRTRLGRPLQGWQPYGQWADTRGGISQPFVLDEKHRLTDPHDPKRKYPLAEGLVHVRKSLRTGGSSVRLTGLSGVGKTRFAQGLFEANAAPDPLPAELAVYTDTARAPNPSPAAVLDELLASGRRAILIVDNCSSQLHGQLTARCKASSRVSLLTIEYDIREDLPSETAVFVLETGSSDLIEKVIKQQFPRVSQVNVATISQFADGNSRVAIALANTLDRRDSLSGLSDRDLLERLFWQGKAAQHELMVAAQACALVYSFNATELDGELAQLAALTGESVAALHRRVVDLESRGLAQRRGPWRAVLPHAVANTLAIEALKMFPGALIDRSLVQGKERLLRSFSRRLGYLHTSNEAIAIVRRWFSKGELLGDLARLTPLLVDVLVNVAPVDPERTLDAIERAVQGPDAARVLDSNNTARSSIIGLVRSIAYESNTFERCVNILVLFARAEAMGKSVESTKDVISSLFLLYLSGTHASTEQRAVWVRAALESSEPEVQEIGRQCLSSALQCDHFSSHYGFEFGARARDYGWSPGVREARGWYTSFIELAAEAGQGTAVKAIAIRDLLASRFRSLWWAGMSDALENAAASFLNDGWEKGWLAIRETIRFDAADFPEEIQIRLRRLEERARPESLVGRVKAIVLDGHSSGVDFADGEDDSTGFERADRVARELGELVAGDSDAFVALLPLVVTNCQGRHWMFGLGLAAGAHSIDDCWARLIAGFEGVPQEQRNVQVLRGFMAGVFDRDRASFERLLEAAMQRASLFKWVPVLQLSAPLDDAGCARLLASMDNSSVPTWVFQHLGYGRATRDLSDDSLAQLLQRLSIRPEGRVVALDALAMHIHGSPKLVGRRVTEVAHALLADPPLSRRNHRMDYELDRLIEYFLKGSEGEPVARQLLFVIRKSLDGHALYLDDLTEALSALFGVQPRAALEILLGDMNNRISAYIRRHAFSGRRRSSVLAKVPLEVLLDWCREGEPERWSQVAVLLPVFGPDTEVVWSEAVLAVLKQAPRPVDVATALVELIEPMSWSGSRAETIRQRLPLLDQLAQVLGSEHAQQIATWREQFAMKIDWEARQELEEHRASNERFE